MKTQKRTENTYYLLTALFWFATSLPLALFVLLIQSRGIDLFQIGILMGVYSAAIVLLEVPTGGLADAVGRKKVALVAYSLSFLASFLFLFSFSFSMLLIGFTIMGVARALSSGTLDAWFVDTLQEIDPEIDMQPLFSKAGTFTLLSLGVGTLLGSLIPDYFARFPLFSSATLFTPLVMPIMAASIVQLVLILSTIALVKETLPDSRTAQWLEGFKKMPEIIKTGFGLTRNNPTLVLLLGTGIAGGFALMGIETFWQPHFADLLGGVEDNSFYFGIIMGGNFMFGMLGNMLATGMTKLLNKRHALTAAIFQGLSGLMLFWLAFQTLPIPAALVFWLVYLSLGVLNSPHQTLLNQEIPSEQRSAMLSIASLFSYTGSILGSALLGYVAKFNSIGFAWQIAGVALTATFMLYWRVDALTQKNVGALAPAASD